MTFLIKQWNYGYLHILCTDFTGQTSMEKSRWVIGVSSAVYTWNFVAYGGGTGGNILKLKSQ